MYSRTVAPLEVVVPDQRHFEELLMEQLLPMPGIADVKSNFVIRTVKANGPLPLTHLA